MEQYDRINNTACALYGSRACALLNQRSCAECPVQQNTGKNAEETADLVERFEALLPEGGIAPLFENETCTLCKTEPKGEATGYAILDFGHSEPKELHARKLFRKGTVGFMVPLQFACCRACRNRLLLSSYLPLLVPLVLTALIVPFVTVPHWSQALRAAASWLPLALVLFGIVGGYGIGKLLQIFLRKPFDRVMYFDLLKHPVSQAMTEKGWFPLFGEAYPQPVLSKKRIRYGLGSAPSAALNGKNAENAEESD